MEPESKLSRLGLAIAAACLLAVATAQAQTGLGADEMKLFAGSYAADCANPAATHLRVMRDALLVEQSTQRMTGRNVMAVASFFEPNPPKGFQVALISEVRGGPQLLFLVYSDKAGQYITLDGDPKVQVALGLVLTKPKYRRCDPPGAPVVAAAPPTPPPPAADADVVPHVSALLADPKFRRAYLRSIGPKASERWLARLEGPAPETRAQTVEGTRYIFVAVCKAHDCYDHSAVFLYSAAQERVLGLIQQNGVKTLVGAPPPSVGAQLERLWQAEFRQK